MDLSMLLSEFSVFTIISLFLGLLAMYFWIQVYFEMKKGSLAWLLLALTSVFLITTSIFPAIAITYSEPVIQSIVLSILAFWSVVYLGTFVAAGFLVHRAFKTVPKENIGEYLVEGLTFEIPTADEVSNLLGKTTLIEYTTQSRYVDGVIELTYRFFGELRTVILFSSEPRASMYREKLMDLVDVGAMKFVEVCMEGDEISIEDEIVRVPVTKMDQILELFDQLPAGARIIFEPLSHLISMLGKDETYRLLSRVVERTSRLKLDLVAFINKEAHDDETINRFRGLFVNYAEVTSDRIRVVKGKKEGHIRFMVGTEFYLNS